MLTKLGWNADVAETGEAGLEKLETISYDAVFIDSGLPGIDGLEVTRRLRSLGGPNASVLVAATTANSTTAHREACLAAGTDAFLTKPITPDRLRTCLSMPARSLRPGPRVHFPSTRMALGLIRYAAGDVPGAMRTYIDRFATDLGLAGATLETAALVGTPASIRAAAHALLSYSRMVGETELSETLSLLEAVCTTGDPAEIAVLYSYTICRAAKIKEKRLQPDLELAPV